MYTMLENNAPLLLGKGLRVEEKQYCGTKYWENKKRLKFMLINVEKLYALDQVQTMGPVLMYCSQV